MAFESGALYRVREAFGQFGAGEVVVFEESIYSRYDGIYVYTFFSGSALKSCSDYDLSAGKERFERIGDSSGLIQAVDADSLAGVEAVLAAEVPERVATLAVALRRAALEGRLEVLPRLLTETKRPELRDLAMLAVRGQQAGVLRKLLEAGADPSGRYGANQTLLTFAVHKGGAEVTKVLLAAGADPDAVDDEGRSPRFFANRHKDPQVLALFASGGKIA